MMAKNQTPSIKALHILLPDSDFSAKILLHRINYDPIKKEVPFCTFLNKLPQAVNSLGK